MCHKKVFYYVKSCISRHIGCEAPEGEEELALGVHMVIKLTNLILLTACSEKKFNSSKSECVLRKQFRWAIESVNILF